MVLLYLAAAAAANLLATWLGPAWTPLVGFALVGFDLTARDALHERWAGRGLRRRMVALVAGGSLLAAAANPGAWRVALASLLSFAVAGAVDAAVYHLARRRGASRRGRMNLSNVASAAIDSVLFPAAAFGVFVPWVTAAQFVAKTAGGALWAWGLTRRSSRQRMFYSSSAPAGWARTQEEEPWRR